MKPAKTFIVEIKKNGRRIQRDQQQIWNEDLLKSETEKVMLEQENLRSQPITQPTTGVKR